MFSDDRVAGSWPKLVARPDTAETARRYAAADPALTGLTDPAGVDDITGALAKTAGPACADDEVLGPVRPAGRYGSDNTDGDPLLHLPSDGVLALASRFPGPDDLVSVIVAELTCRIRSIPSRLGTRTYAATLLLASEGAPVGPGRRAAAREFGAHEQAIRRCRSSALCVPRAA